jgi:hypothetical protein
MQLTKVEAVVLGRGGYKLAWKWAILFIDVMDFVLANIYPIVYQCSVGLGIP